LRLQARDAQAAGDRMYWPIFNLDIKNPNAPQEETHDPDVLLEKYKTLLGEIEETENQLKSELAAALAHHFGPEACTMKPSLPILNRKLLGKKSAN
jgi:type I restriction enzyme M protein